MSHIFDCPFCETQCEVEGEDLPDNACDDAVYECINCSGEMKIGWVAQVEVRSVTVCAGDID